MKQYHQFKDFWLCNGPSSSSFCMLPNLFWVISNPLQQIWGGAHRERVGNFCCTNGNPCTNGTTTMDTTKMCFLNKDIHFSLKYQTRAVKVCQKIKQPHGGLKGHGLVECSYCMLSSLHALTYAQFRMPEQGYRRLCFRMDQKLSNSFYTKFSQIAWYNHLRETNHWSKAPSVLPPHIYSIDPSLISSLQELRINKTPLR